MIRTAGRIIALAAFANTALWADKAEDLADEPTHNLAYGGLPRQKLDVYVPKEAKDAPIMVFFHGGAWTLGNKAMHAFVGKAYAKKGVLTIVPNYRLYPEVTFPDFMDDATLAVKWVRANAAKYGGNTDHIILAGHSAGGHIASLLGTDQKYLGGKAGKHSEWLRGVVSLAGVLDTPLAKLGPAQHVFDGSRREQVMPISFIDGADPPFLLVQGNLDPLVYASQAKSFEAALRKSKVEVVTSYQKYAEHGLVLAGFTGHVRRLGIMDATLKFIEKRAPQQ